MKKYAINILVILFLLTPFTLFANGCHANNDTIKVLAIGNSFSQDAVEQYLHELGEAEGITMIIGNMFIGGCSLERHVQNIRNNAPAYAYRKVEKDGEKTETRSMTIEKALADEKWDYISRPALCLVSMTATKLPYLNWLTISGNELERKPY